MKREEAREYINSRAKDYLEKDGSGRGFICPVCGSGSGAKGTGITTKDGVHFTCWAGCYTHSDIIDIIGKQYGLTDYNSQLEKACNIFNVEIESYHKSSAEEDFRENQNQPKNEQITQQKLHNFNYTTKVTQQANNAPEVDYTDFFLQAAKDLNKTDYHRGISEETLQRFNVGYIENWRHPKAPNSPTTPRLIIPTSSCSYLARDTRANIPEEQKQYSKSKVGSSHIFNVGALKTAQKPIIIVEGEIDALSIIDVGGVAIGLGSVSNCRALLSLLEAEKPAQPLIIALDNDPAGEKATTQLKEGLDALKITYYEYNVATPHKDANIALTKDREAFTLKVEQAENIEAAALEAERDALNRESVFCSFVNFLEGIKESKNNTYIPTGFSRLDTLLDGGLYAGLYIIGAISSLGKTTLTLQIADNIARSGNDVLIFSLEMAQSELMAKSISRLTFIQDTQKNHTSRNAKTVRGILTGSRYNSYSEKEKQLIASAEEEYINNYASHIFITEGMGNVTAATIIEKVKRHKRITGKAPVVLIDYLQIIAPADIRGTDKQNTDINVTALKRLSRDFNIPVIGVSSFNRDNYTAPVNLASFKESGAIEYSSDVLIGMQYEGMDYQENNGKAERDGDREKRIRTLVKDNQNKAKNGQAQQIQVKILKNRNGSKGDISLFYYPMFNYFTQEEVNLNSPAAEDFEEPEEDLF